MTAVNTVTIVVAKPGAAEAVEGVLARVADGSRDATGCPRYRSWRDLDDPNTFVTSEQWDSSESVAAHLAGPNLQVILAETRSLLAAPPRTIYVGEFDGAC